MFVRQNYYFFRLFQHCVNKDFLHQMKKSQHFRNVCISKYYAEIQAISNKIWQCLYMFLI